MSGCVQDLYHPTWDSQRLFHLSNNRESSQVSHRKRKAFVDLLNLEIDKTWFLMTKMFVCNSMTFSGTL